VVREVGVREIREGGGGEGGGTTARHMPTNQARGTIQFMYGSPCTNTHTLPLPPSLPPPFGKPVDKDAHSYRGEASARSERGGKNKRSGIN